MSASSLLFSQDITLRKIIHVDMDCFYAAIEMKDFPELKGKPLAIGGSAESRSVLCTANYEARKFGVHSAMSTAVALRKCPQLIVRPTRFSRYKEISTHIQTLFHDYTDLVEPLSLDEAYLDVTQYCEDHACYAQDVAKEIKDRIFEETGLSASAGVAPNKFLAKVASDWKKPNGLFVIPPEKAAEFAYHLPLPKVPGIGKVSAERSRALGLHTLGDIREKGQLWATDHFGKNGHLLYLKSFGIHNSPVGRNYKRKSISCEHTFHQDLVSFDEIKTKIPSIYEDFQARLKKVANQHEYSTTAIKKLFVKIKTHQFKNHTYEALYESELPLGDAPLDIELFTSMAKILYRKIGRCPIRLLGFGVKLNYTQMDEIERMGQLRLL